MAYISAATGSYYEGDRAHALDKEVPQRPSLLHTWDGSAWIADWKQVLIAPHKARLAEIDAVYQITQRPLRDISLTLAHVIDKLIAGTPFTEEDRISLNKGILAVAQIETALCTPERDAIAAINAMTEPLK